MTTPSSYPASGKSAVAVAEGTSAQIDYSKVRAYWKSARPSTLGPYMMDGFGFPPGAGEFRFRGELKAVEKAIGDLGPNTSVLDLGSGVGVWTEYFARRFARVVAVEASATLYAAMKDRCSRYPNVTTYNRDVLSYEPKGEFGPNGGFGLVFLGGLLMYLNGRDIQAVLRRLIPCLEPGGLVLCRESTVRHGVRALQDDYHVVYRSVETYRDIFADAGFDVMSVRTNTAYINVQMGCELVKKWKAMVPDRFRCLSVVGWLAHWGLRLGYPWNARLIPWLLAGMGQEFPKLTNHFFVLRPSLQTPADRRGTSAHRPRIEEEISERAR